MAISSDSYVTVEIAIRIRRPTAARGLTIRNPAAQRAFPPSALVSSKSAGFRQRQCQIVRLGSMIGERLFVRVSAVGGFVE
jgi:hypothetical protein